MELKTFIENQIASGKCCFTIDDVYKQLRKSKNANLLALSRLIIKGEITNPTKGFYVIIPPEYRIKGSIPAEQFIPYLMQYLGYNYYAGLITAAAYYGAAHQAPQVFQVMTNKKRSGILICGKVKIQFIRNNDVKTTPITQFSTPKSKILISSPEATAMDLFKFVKQSGGLNNIVTILTELRGSLDAKKLKLILENHTGLSWKQRLGFVLEIINAKVLANVVKEHLSKESKLQYIYLSASLKKTAVSKKNKTWKIIENKTIESDI